MADEQNTTTATSQAPSSTSGSQGDSFANMVNSKIKKITGGRKDQFADLVNSKLSMIQGNKDDIHPVHLSPDQEHGSLRVYEPTWWQRIKNIYHKGAGEALSDASYINRYGTGDITAEVGQFAQHPLVALESLFPDNPKSGVGRFSKGAVSAASGLTSPTQIALMAAPAIKGIDALPQAIHAIGLAMMPTVSIGIAQSAKRIYDAHKVGDTAAEQEGYGDLAFNLAAIIVPHVAGRVAENVKYGKLNDSSGTLYKKKFSALTDEQKMHVLYSVIEDADPKFRKRVDAEVDRINASRGVSEDREAIHEVAKKASQGEVDVVPPTPSEETTQRIQAAKNLVRQMLVSKARREAYQKQAQAREAQAREEAIRRGEQDRKSAAAQEEAERAAERSPKDSRSVTRVRGVVKTSERIPEQMYQEEPSGSAIPVSERRSAAGEIPTATSATNAAEAKVQELSEQRMGQSFSTLPLARQRVAARWMEKNHPEAWTAFQSTPAYSSFKSHVETASVADAALKQYTSRNSHGEAESLAPNADLQVGIARLVLNHTDYQAALKADQEAYRSLNSHSEQSMGKSFDSLDADDRVPALAEYLRDNPDGLKTFLTPDLSARLGSGQHIDLANIEAELVDKRQASMLMEFRDEVRRNMDQTLADEMVDASRQEHNKEISDAMYASLSGRGESLEAVHSAARGLTQEASDLGLGTVSGFEDLFRLERQIQNTRPDLRTSKMSQFLTHMRQVRVAAEDHILTSLANATAESLRGQGVEARNKAARQVVELSDRSQDMQTAADHLRVAGDEERAKEVEQVAVAEKAKADAITVGVQMSQEATNPSVVPSRPSANVVLGRSTRVVTPRNPEGYQAHYAIADLSDLQTSHMPDTFEQRPGYNQKGQPRNYAADRDAQVAAHERAGRLDTDVLLSNGVTTMEGPAVVDQDMHVISANGRTLSMMIAAREHPEEWAKYVKDLHEAAVQFGIDPSSIFGKKNPVLVKVLDAAVDKNSPQWALMGIDMNDSPSRGISSEDMGVALSRMLTPEFVDRLSSVVESMPTFDSNGRALTVREAMRIRSGDIADLMQAAGVISPNRRSEFITDKGELNERSKDLFENLLSGLTVTDPAVLGRSSASVRDKLTRAGLFFLRMRNAGENWNLASMNTDAVRLLHRAESTRIRLERLVPREGEKESSEGSLVDRYLHPEKYQDSKGFGSEMTFEFDGQPLHEPVHPAVESLAKALEESPREYTKMIARYSDRAEGIQGSMFGAEHPADAFTSEVASRYGLNVVPEEWGSVVGLTDAERNAFEESRGPLPVEAEEHHAQAIADVVPDSSSVTETMNEGPRTVRELRKALESHPGFTEEQAAAASEMIENILPRAIGEDLGNILGNRRLSFLLGGEEGSARGYHEILDEGRAIIGLFNSADSSTLVHEMAHYVRRYLRPSDQAVANEFVGAKPGEEWTEAQEEKFAQAFERYHYDGGIRRGKLEKVFQTIHRAMQSIYNAVTGRGLANPSDAVVKMFDSWYDWNRAERKPITARLDVDALEAAASGKVEIPETARVVDSSDVLPAKDAHVYVFVDRKAASDFVLNKKNGITRWEVFEDRGANHPTTYVRAESRKGKRLMQPSLNEMIELAKRAKDLESRLKKETDPREQARLRGALNGIEDKMRGATGIIGGAPEPRDTSAIQLIYGVGEMPKMSEPTTPAQAVTAHQVFGDPTGFEIGGKREKGRVSDETSGEGQGPIEGVHGGSGTADREHASSAIATPKTDPLAKVKAAKLKAPEVQRGTPVVSPEVWREHVEALGLPDGTPPPTVRIDSDVRQMLIYPGQAEAVEGALSALQQYDGTILASGAGTGKSHMLSAIAAHMGGDFSDKVGLLVTRSQNLIHEADGFVETARKYGVDVSSLPSDMKDLTTGMYAATYAGIRGNRGVMSIPWDFVLFDESGEAANWTESEQGKAVVLLGHAAKKVVYSSATPYSTVMELGYMHKLGMWPKGGFFEWAQQFGLREVGPNTYAGGAAAKKLEKLRQQLIERGQWQQLYKDMSGTEAHVALVPQSEEVKTGVRNIRAAFEMARNAFIRSGMSKYITPTAGHESIYLKRYIAGARLKEAIELGKKAMAQGWKPVFFTEYRSPAEEGMAFFHNLPGDLGEKVNKMLPPLPNIVAEMKAAFGDKVGIFAGSANESRAAELEQFHTGEKDALYMTYAAGGVGASAHDKVGDRPRIDIFIDMPWGGKMLEQGTNRTWRYGSQSGVLNVFMTSDALPEMKLLATKVLPRMRALKAAVFGEKMESSLSKSLREASGIPEELLQYEHGEEVAPEAAEFEKLGDGVDFSKIDEFEVPKSTKYKNRPMEYKGKGRKLYQGPKDEDPFERLVREQWTDVLARTAKLPAKQERMIAANEGAIKAEAKSAARMAMGSGESAKSASERKVRDMENDALIWFDGLKDNTRAANHFVKSSLWMFGTSGDKAVEKIFADAGMSKEGAEMRRRMIDYDIRMGNYRGEFGGMVEKIIFDNKLNPADLELVSKVVEGQATSTDPRIMKAVGEFRKFTAYVRQRMANSGVVVTYNDKGKRVSVPYSKIEDDPNYWPRMYDWNKKFVLTDPKTGKKEVTTLSRIMDMPSGSERRESMIERFAESRGISKMQAQLFFDRNSRGIRLAGNVERAREFDMPGYGRDRKALDRYIGQVSETMAATEVHGQFREDTDHLIDQLPDEKTRLLVNHIVTADLNPARLHDSDRMALRAVNYWLVVSKMSLSAMKLPFHIAKTSLATNTRSVVASMLKTATSHRELKRNAMDCGAMTDYIRQAWMREYGLGGEGWFSNLDQKMLKFNGFTFILNQSRIIAAGAGRLWFEKYAYPELKKNPTDPVLRRKLNDLYGFTDEHLDSIIANGYGPEDVRRMELGAANWTTGSGRPSELPPALRGTSGQPVYDRLTTLLRISQSLHGFMFKTANLVNRTVWHELYKSDWKSPAPYQLIARFTANFGLAGLALQQILHMRHQMAGSPEADIEKRRDEWIEAHPMSKEALFSAMSHVTMGMGIDVLSQLFDELATHDAKDKLKLVQQERTLNAGKDLLIGVFPNDVYTAVKATKDYQATFEDTGRHELSPEQRREQILARLANEEVPMSRYIIKPKHLGPRALPRRRRRSTGNLQ